MIHGDKRNPYLMYAQNLYIKKEIPLPNKCKNLTHGHKGESFKTKQQYFFTA